MLPRPAIGFNRFVRIEIQQSLHRMRLKKNVIDFSLGSMLRFNFEITSHEEPTETGVKTPV